MFIGSVRALTEIRNADHSSCNFILVFMSAVQLVRAVNDISSQYNRREYLTRVDFDSGSFVDITERDSWLFVSYLSFTWMSLCWQTVNFVDWTSCAAWYHSYVLSAVHISWLLILYCLMAAQFTVLLQIEYNEWDRYGINAVYMLACNQQHRYWICWLIVKLYVKICNYCRLCLEHHFSVCCSYVRMNV